MGRNGLVHIYTGEGKGKTTAAVGLGVRACGSGMKVLLVQFLKSRNTGELNSIRKLGPDFTVSRGFNCTKFVWDMSETELTDARKEAAGIFHQVKKVVERGDYDVIILDEILGLLSIGFIPEADVLELIHKKAKGIELILTGRGATEQLMEAADYVSCINAIKHPYEKGVPARKGIEF